MIEGRRGRSGGAGQGAAGPAGGACEKGAAQGPVRRPQREGGAEFEQDGRGRQAGPTAFIGSLRNESHPRHLVHLTRSALITRPT